MKPSVPPASRLRFPPAPRAVLVAVALCAPLVACGGAPTPAVATPPAAAVQGALPAASAAPGLDPKAVELCLATANAKRAKFSGEPPKVTVKHVLVKHAGAKNPVAGVKRTREEACLRATEARDKIRGGSDFAEVVKEFSDEPGAATREGSVGAIERTDVAKPFADAAFELGLNQLSDLVETESGFHLILRKE